MRWLYLPFVAAWELFRDIRDTSRMTRAVRQSFKASQEFQRQGYEGEALAMMILLRRVAEQDIERARKLWGRT